MNFQEKLTKVIDAKSEYQKFVGEEMKKLQKGEKPDFKAIGKKWQAKKSEKKEAEIEKEAAADPAFKKIQKAVDGLGGTIRKTIETMEKDKTLSGELKQLKTVAKEWTKLQKMMAKNLGRMV